MFVAVFEVYHFHFLKNERQFVIVIDQLIFLIFVLFCIVIKLNSVTSQSSITLSNYTCSFHTCNAW